MKGCEKCDYKGYIRINTFEVVTCECAKKNDLSNRMIEACIPKCMAKAKLEDWNLKQNPSGEDLTVQQIKNKEKAYKVLSSIYNNKSFPYEPIDMSDKAICNISFMGPAESGKTFCTSILCKKAVANGALVKFYDWFDLVAMLDRFDNKLDIESAVFNFTNCDLVAINGIMPSDVNAQARNQLSRLFRKRLNANLWTIISGSDIPSGIFPGWNEFYSNSLVVRLI
jgi:DNA replication protein DnaC